MKKIIRTVGSALGFDIPHDTPYRPWLHYHKL